MQKYSAHNMLKEHPLHFRSINKEIEQILQTLSAEGTV